MEVDAVSQAAPVHGDAFVPGFRGGVVVGVAVPDVHDLSPLIQAAPAVAEAVKVLVGGQVPNGLGLGKVEGVIGEQSLSVGVIDGEGQGLPAENQLQLSGVYDIGVRIQVRSAFPVFVRLYDGGVAGKICGKLAAGAYPQPYHLLGQEANLHLVAVF